MPKKALKIVPQNTDLNANRHRCPTMNAFNTSGDIVVVLCGQWKCSICSRLLARKYASITAYGVNQQGGKAYFWTLTMGRRIKSPRRAYELIPTMWDALRKSMQRKYKEWQYIAFVEGQPKRGNMPHFHIITMKPCPRGRLKDYAHSFGFGFQAKEEIVEGWEAAGYVAKYATKQNPETPKGFRRVRKSQKWPVRSKVVHDSLIVRSVRERIEDYLQRVSRLTGIHPNKLANLWYSKMEEQYETLAKAENERSNVVPTMPRGKIRTHRA